MPKGHYNRPKRAAIFPIGPSIAYIPLTKGGFSLVDWDDAVWLQQRHWSMHLCDKNGSWYALSHKDWLGKRVTRSMHADIMTINGEGLTVDHVDPSATLDNRRCNLRVATKSQQCINRRQFSNNKSGFRGVSFHKVTGRWQASIGVSKKQLYLGLYETKELAYEAYLKAAGEYHGRYSLVL